MRIIAFPKNGSDYTKAFYRPLEALGTPVVEGIFSGGWLYSNIRPGDWVHLHWPSFSYASDAAGPRALYRFARFMSLLLLARLRGARVVWTAHNLLPHDRNRIPVLDVIGRHFMIAVSSIILVHGSESARLLTQRFPSARRKIVLIPQGNWIDFYVVDTTREAARERLGIPRDAYVYLFIGLCKPYKNIAALLDAFARVPGSPLLLIVGNFQDPQYRERIIGMAARDARVRVIPGYVPDDEIQYYLLSCDIVVVPYRETLTSGTAMLAISYGKPVVSVAKGNLPELVPREAGVLYDPDAAEGLVEALRRCRECVFDGRIIEDHARRFSFDDSARIFLEAMSRERKGKP